MPYTIKQLCEQGSPFVMAMMFRVIDRHQPFVTYSEIKDELQHQLGIDVIFSMHPGYPAGNLMSEILAKDPRAPLLNCLITTAAGLPSGGISNHLAIRYPDEIGRNWKSFPHERKLEIVERERSKVHDYPHWEVLARELYGEIRTLRPRKP